MTIRDLITMGANLDAPICIKVRTYDKDGIRTNTHYFYKDISQDNFTINDNLLTITVDVDEV